jgi:sec-independent protein translocase protein TatA
MFQGIFQPLHLVVILFILLLIFGPKKPGDLGKGLGKGLRDIFRGGGPGGPKPA